MEFPRRMALAEVKEVLLRGLPLMFVDARNENDWRDDERVLPRALRIAPDDVERHLDEVPRDGTDVVVYCGCPNEASSARVAQALFEHGVSNVSVLDGGFRRWRDSDSPMERRNERHLHRVPSQPNLVHDKGIPADIEHEQKRTPLAD